MGDVRTGAQARGGGGGGAVALVGGWFFFFMKVAREAMLGLKWLNSGADQLYQDTQLEAVCTTIFPCKLAS
jgi:hypothetical protein